MGYSHDKGEYIHYWKNKVLILFLNISCCKRKKTLKRIKSEEPWMLFCAHLFINTTEHSFIATFLFNIE